MCQDTEKRVYRAIKTSFRDTDYVLIVRSDDLIKR